MNEVDPAGLVPPSHDPWVTQHHFDGSRGRSPFNSLFVRWVKDTSGQALEGVGNLMTAGGAFLDIVGLTTLGGMASNPTLALATGELLGGAIPAIAVGSLAGGSLLTFLGPKVSGLGQNMQMSANPCDGSIQMVDPRSLVSRQHPREMRNGYVDTLKKDMKKNGFRESQPVEFIETEGMKIIHEGHHRTKAARLAKLKKIPAIEIKVSPETAKMYFKQVMDAMREGI